MDWNFYNYLYGISNNYFSLLQLWFCSICLQKLLHQIANVCVDSNKTQEIEEKNCIQYSKVVGPNRFENFKLFADLFFHWIGYTNYEEIMRQNLSKKHKEREKKISCRLLSKIQNPQILLNKKMNKMRSEKKIQKSTLLKS